MTEFEAPKVLKVDHRVTHSNLDHNSVSGFDPKQLHLINCAFPVDRALITTDQINCEKHIIHKGLPSHDIQIK